MDQMQAVASAIIGYLDLMHDFDDSRFLEVFHRGCLVHKMREGKLATRSASEFR